MHPTDTLCAGLQGSFHGNFNETDYEMKDHWDTAFPANLFGQNAAAIKERSSLELDAPDALFPVFARACYQCHLTPSGQDHTF